MQFQVEYNESIVRQHLCGWIAAVVPLQSSKYVLVPLISVLVASGGCQFFGYRSSIPTYYNLPLNVRLSMDQSIDAASVEYRDACGQAVALPLQAQLEKEIQKRLGQVFERVQVRSGPSTEVPDGMVEIALGPRQVNLFVPRKANKSYPATVMIGLDFTYTDRQGTVLQHKKLQSSATGEVEATAESCDIAGLDKVAQETIEIVVEGMAQHLGTATKIREQVQLKKEGRMAAAPSPAESVAPAEALFPAVQAEPAPPAPPNNGSPQSMPSAAPPASSAVVPSGPTRLSFRTIIRDDNQNHVLEQGEPFSVEFEVKNEGTAVAQGVEIDLSGHAAIVGGLTSPVSLGSLQPGEVRRVAVGGKVGVVPNIEQAELICALRASPHVELPTAKKFLVAIRPDRSDAVEVLSVDVDQLPAMNGKYAQPQAVGIAVGVGAFRDPAMPSRKFAARDAEVMGTYFKAVLGIPPQKIRVVIDEGGLKDDLADIFEQWLPKQAGVKQTAYIYVSGRALVDQETGAVSLMPYDGTMASAGRTFSLARLQRALTRAPLKQAVLMLDLSLEPSAGSGSTGTATPRWNQQDAAGEHDRLMIMVGNSGVQEAQAYQQGQHGLFTYFLLKGMRGAADLDKNGTVVTGELCAYVHGQVEAATRMQSGNAQQTLCLPEPGERSFLRGIPVTKSH